MQLFSNEDKNKVAYLCALTLMFSYAELLLPRIVPFFRLGLGNIPVLLGFGLRFPAFLLLVFVKALCASLTSGTLFTPFVLISVGQSVASGCVMYLLNKSLGKIKDGKFLSLYGISVCGSAVSAFVQIFLSSIYLGRGTWTLLGPMLVFSLFSAFVTAFIALCMNLTGETPVLKYSSVESKKRNWAIPVLIFILILIILTFVIDNLWILLGFTIFSLAMQKLCGRKIFVLSYFCMWLFVIFTSLLVPEGKVLFGIGSFNVTYGALQEGVIKSLKLTSVMALSQACAALDFGKSNGFVVKVLLFYKGMNNAFLHKDGKLLEKLNYVLSLKEIYV